MKAIRPCAEKTAFRRRLRSRSVLAFGFLSLVIAAGVFLWKAVLARDARLARSALNSGQHAAAELAAERLLRYSFGSSEALLIKARIAIAQNRIPEANEILRQARSNGADGPEIELVVALLAAKIGRLSEAEPILIQAFLQPRTPDPQLDEALARVYLERFDLPRASTVIDRWKSDAPNDPKPYLWQTEIDRRLPDLVGALIVDYREALKRDPTSAQARLGLAEQLLKAKREKEAAAEYTAYLSLRPDDPAGHIGAGIVAIELGDESAAMRHFDRAVALDPKNVQVYQERASAEMRRGNMKAALVQLDRAIVLDPYSIEIRYSRGLALARLGKTTEARAENVIANQLRADSDRLTNLKNRLFDSPDDRDLQCQVAQWLFDHGKPEEGFRWAEKIIKEQPNHPHASRQLADYYENKGQQGLANFYRLQAIPTSKNP